VSVAESSHSKIDVSTRAWLPSFNGSFSAIQQNQSLSTNHVTPNQPRVTPNQLPTKPRVRLLPTKTRVRLVILPTKPRVRLVVLSPSNWNIKHYKSVDILSNFQNVKSPCANVIPPLLKTFWRRFWFEPHIISRDGFADLESEKVRSTRIVNLAVQPVGCVLHDVFCSCVWNFYSRGKRTATWSPRCALSSLCRHTYVQCGWLLRAQIRKDRCETYKNVGHVFCQIFQPWRFRLVCLWKLIILFPPAKHNFHNSVSSNFLRRR